MRWSILPAVALAIALGALGACTDGAKPNKGKTAEAPPIAKPTQSARVNSTTEQGYGCEWSATFDRRLVTELDDVTTHCDHLSSGKRFTVVVQGRASPDSGINKGELLVLSVTGPGLKETIAAPFKTIGDGPLKFGGQTTNVAVVPSNGSVDARVDFVECRDRNSRPFDCRIDNLVLSVRSNR